jgi:hypothetical protein
VTSRSTAGGGPALFRRRETLAADHTSRYVNRKSHRRYKITGVSPM